ncbi:hypothetical protein HDU93_006065, partial [Gonapodya sp. JEL0774]
MTDVIQMELDSGLPMVNKCGPLCLLSFAVFLVYYVDAIRSRGFYMVLAQELGMGMALIIEFVKGAMILMLFILESPETCLSAVTVLFTHLGTTLMFGSLLLRAFFLFMRLYATRELLQLYGDTLVMDVNTGVMHGDISKAAMRVIESTSGTTNIGDEDAMDKLQGRTIRAMKKGCYLLRHKDFMTEKTMLKIMVAVATVVTICGLVILAVNEHKTQGCVNGSTIAAVPALVFFNAVFYVLSPWAIYLLRNSKGELNISFFVYSDLGELPQRTIQNKLSSPLDAHGIRSDLIISFGVALPSFALYGTWSALGIDDRWPSVLLYFNSSLIIATMSAVLHTTVVVRPVLTTLKAHRGKTRLLPGSEQSAAEFEQRELQVFTFIVDAKNGSATP